MAPQLDGWANFYVIVGSSAGALIGLQFVVIALVSSTRGSAVSGAMRAFATPTIVYFATVLLTAGLLSIPRHTETSASIVLLAIGAAGLGYVVWVATHIRRQGQYSPDRADWAWFVFLPAAAYAGFFAAGAMIGGSPAPSLDVAGAAAMLLLLIGVHNAWDGAVWMVARRPEEPEA